MMNVLSIVTMLNVRQWMENAWRNLVLRRQARRSEKRLQMLHRKVRRLDRQCTSLKKRMHDKLRRSGRADFCSLSDADWC